MSEKLKIIKESIKNELMTLKLLLLKLLKTQKFYFGGKKMAVNLGKTYERLMYSEDREELVMALNFTKSIYDRARKMFHWDCINDFLSQYINKSDVDCFRFGNFRDNSMAYLKSRKSWLSAKISLIDKEQFNNL